MYLGTAQPRVKEFARHIGAAFNQHALNLPFTQLFQNHCEVAALRSIADNLDTGRHCSGCGC